MRRRRIVLAAGLVAAVVATGYGIYLLGFDQGAEAVADAGADPARFGFLLIPALAVAGGWLAEWNAFLAAGLLVVAAVIALVFFGMTLPALILVVLLGAAAALIALPDLL